MAFARAAMFDWVRVLFGGRLTAGQVGGIEAILAQWEARRPQGDRRHLAYMLATAFHETNRQMQPVREAYWLSEAWRKAHLPYHPYYGRGYVQLTHKENYVRAGRAVGRNLADDPDKALDPALAGAIMIEGMEQGWFRASADGRRHSLVRYFSQGTDDPVGARAIINGREIKQVDGRAVLLATVIAGYHRGFLMALEDGSRQKSA